MIQRTIKEAIMRTIKPGKVILVYGARRVGKTVLIKQIAEEFSGKTLFLNGEDSEVETMFLTRSASHYRQLFSGIDLLVVDEAQNIPDIGRILKLIVDEIENIRVIASGSSSFDLKNQTGEPLVGRSYTFHLSSLAISEWLSQMPVAQLYLSLEEKLIYGGYPELKSPRWIVLISDSQIALIDRNKWNEKRFLLFDLNDIFGRNEESTLQAMAVLLHRESLCPTDGGCLLDAMDEISHRHAIDVSKELKYALRQCIEILGNEVVYDMRERQHVGVFGRDLAEDLTLQCLRYMYRILFMLFIEAKPELGYAPMKAQTYESGYSFESLREICEQAEGDGEINEDGNFLKESLDKLFGLVYAGFPTKIEVPEDAESLQGVFAIEPLKAHIFDPERTQLIEKAHLRNGKLLQIINLMSLARSGKGQRRGRISYSNLGVNQLGAVYEALLSYRGFFAEEDLYEVKRAGDKVDELDVGYFIPLRDLDQYTEGERVRVDQNDQSSALRVHPKGEFIYRLAGREREKSASYYTPEVLTRCLVKYALKELLEDKSADDILSLTICESKTQNLIQINDCPLRGVA